MSQELPGKDEEPHVANIAPEDYLATDSKDAVDAIADGSNVENINGNVFYGNMKGGLQDATGQLDVELLEGNTVSMSFKDSSHLDISLKDEADLKENMPSENNVDKFGDGADPTIYIDEDTQMHDHAENAFVSVPVSSPHEVKSPIDRGDVSSPFSAMESDGMETGFDEASLSAPNHRKSSLIGISTPLVSTTTPGASSSGSDPELSSSSRKKRRRTRREMPSGPLNRGFPNDYFSNPAAEDLLDSSAQGSFLLNQSDNFFVPSYNNFNGITSTPSSVTSPSSAGNPVVPNDQSSRFPILLHNNDNNVKQENFINPMTIKNEPNSDNDQTSPRRAKNSLNFTNAKFPLTANYPSSTHDYELKIVAQPEAQHRARYLTEGSRGPVKDSSQQGYPKVELIGYDPSESLLLEVFVGAENGKPVKPHGFYQACKVTGRNTTPCDEIEIDGTKVIQIPFQSGEPVLSVDCVGILKLRNADVEARIGVAKAKKRSQTARLVFRIQLPGKPGQKPTILQTTSVKINCTQPPGPPEIQKKSIDRCSVEGNADVFIIGKNFHRGTKVVFRDPEQSDGSHWSQEGEIDKDSFHQSHMVVTVPPYHDQTIQKPVNVQMLVNYQGRRCEPHSFTYTPIQSGKGDIAAGSPMSMTYDQPINSVDSVVDASPTSETAMAGESTSEKLKRGKEIQADSKLISLLTTLLASIKGTDTNDDAPNVPSEITPQLHDFISNFSQQNTAKVEPSSNIQKTEMEASNQQLQASSIGNQQQVNVNQMLHTSNENIQPARAPNQFIQPSHFQAPPVLNTGNVVVNSTNVPVQSQQPVQNFTSQVPVQVISVPAQSMPVTNIQFQPASNFIVSPKTEHKPPPIAQVSNTPEQQNSGVPSNASSNVASPAFSPSTNLTQQTSWSQQQNAHDNLQQQQQNVPQNIQQTFTSQQNSNIFTFGAQTTSSPDFRQQNIFTNQSSAFNVSVPSSFSANFVPTYNNSNVTSTTLTNNVPTFNSNNLQTVSSVSVVKTEGFLTTKSNEIWGTQQTQSNESIAPLKQFVTQNETPQVFTAITNTQPVFQTINPDALKLSFQNNIATAFTASGPITNHATPSSFNATASTVTQQKPVVSNANQQPMFTISQSVPFQQQQPQTQFTIIDNNASKQRTMEPEGTIKLQQNNATFNFTPTQQQHTNQTQHSEPQSMQTHNIPPPAFPQVAQPATNTNQTFLNSPQQQQQQKVIADPQINIQHQHMMQHQNLQQYHLQPQQELAPVNQSMDVTLKMLGKDSIKTEQKFVQPAAQILPQDINQNLKKQSNTESEQSSMVHYSQNVEAVRMSDSVKPVMVGSNQNSQLQAGQMFENQEQRMIVESQQQQQSQQTQNTGVAFQTTFIHSNNMCSNAEQAFLSNQQNNAMQQTQVQSMVVDENCKTYSTDNAVTHEQAQESSQQQFNSEQIVMETEEVKFQNIMEKQHTNMENQQQGGNIQFQNNHPNTSHEQSNENSTRTAEGCFSMDNIDKLLQSIDGSENFQEISGEDVQQQLQ